MGIFDKGVKKTNMGFFQRLSHAIVGKAKVDDDLLDAIEEALVATDMGVDTTLKIIENLEDRVSRDKYVTMDELIDMLRDEIATLLNVKEGETSDDIVEPFDFSKKPYVIMVVGVNGVGKTTTIGKLASRLQAQGKKVVVGAADTFRAAAVDQLTIWAERAGVDIVKQDMGSDPASVAFDTVKSAVAKNADVVLIDTAGRLHNRIDLMNEPANVDVDLLFTAEGRFEVVASAYAQSDIGLKYQKGKISMINDNKSSVSLTAEAEGEIRLGPTLTVGVGIDPPLVDPINVFDVYGNLGVGIHAETGIEHVLSQENGDASYKAHNNTPDADGNIHICDICVDGNVFLFLTGDAGISSDVTDLLECGKLRVDFGEVQKNITDWYFSISTKNDKIGKFGLGTCPNVYRPIKFTKQPAGVKASMGTAVKLEAKAGAGKNGTDKETQKIVYKWYKDGKEIANEFSNVLTIKSAAVEDSGTYTCKAYYSALGEEVLFADSKEAKVEVTAFDKGPEITKQPENVTVDEGFGVSMSVAVKTPEGAMVEFQWYKNGAAIANATASSYSIAAADKSSEGTYYCIAKISGFDNLATKSASATLTVKTKADKEKENQDGVLDTDIFGGNNTSLEGLEGKKPANDGGVLDTDIFG